MLISKLSIALVASEQVELVFSELETLGVENETHPLAASRRRRVVKNKSANRTNPS